MQDYTEPTTTQPKTIFDDLDLRLIIPLEAYKKIISYALVAEKIEITGFAESSFDRERGEFRVGDVYLLEQNAGAADVHIEEEDLSKFMLELIKKGKKQMPQIWWHSHVDMGAFFSSTDEKQLKDFQNDTYIIALVVNKRGEMKAKMYVKTKSKIVVESALTGEEIEEVEEQIEIDPLPVHIEYFNKSEIPNTIKAEVKKKLKEREIEYHLPHNPFKGIFGTGKHEKKTNRRDSTGKGAGVGASDIHDEYTDDPKVAVFKLPKSTEEAQRKIYQLGLKHRYNWTAQEWVWQAEGGTDIWVDYWECLPFGWAPSVNN